ncbi:hypothetical protein [Leptolyngbya sp. FACHB-8]|uniref:hypothetical protein n=1 Tax=unclassified Leptolyngbya TaxID=2650499 RepID=UPI001687C3FD|nr:hypothetical protein [Leptolyngbya sp. FACHB-8]MBD1914091.1 hypothetical protein [Leptolyngbya sp. FACHB-8]
MKLPIGCWCFARFAGKAPTSWVNSCAQTSYVGQTKNWKTQWTGRSPQYVGAIACLVWQLTGLRLISDILSWPCSCLKRVVSITQIC